MKIRKATKKDLKQILKAYQKEYSRKPYLERWGSKFLARKLKMHLKWDEIFLATINNKIVGFVIFDFYEWHDGWRIYIEDIAVSKEFQGKGAGKALLRKVEEEAKRKRVAVIVLDVKTKSEAYKLYKKIGYKKVPYDKMEKKIK